MLRILIFTLLALANSQSVVEINSSPQRLNLLGGQSGIKSFSASGLQGLHGLSGASGLSGLSLYGLGSNRAISLGNYGASPVSYAIAPIGLSSLQRYGVANYGANLRPSAFGVIGAQPAAINLVSAQPASVGFVASQPAINLVSAQPASIGLSAVRPSINLVSGGAQQVAFTSQPRITSQQVVPVSAAIQSLGRTVEYKVVPYNDEPLAPQVIEVEPSEIPLNIHFKSRSSTIQVTQSHTPGEPGTVEQTQSQDEPSRVVHEVVKPVIQEVREVITPYRQVTQEVQPVVEQVHTVVSRGEGVRQTYVQQPVVQQNLAAVSQPAVSSIQVAQPVAAFQAVAQPISQVQAVAQPVATLAVAQPISTVQAVAQPVQSVQAFAQPVAYQVGVAQPVGSYVQSFRSAAVQPASVYSVAAQPAVSGLSVASQPVLSGISVEAQPAVAFRSASIGVSNGVALNSGSSLPAGTATFSRTFAESDDESK